MSKPARAHHVFPDSNCLFILDMVMGHRDATDQLMGLMGQPCLSILELITKFVPVVHPTRQV